MNNHCKLARMWINQPSIAQPLHYKHGTNVLAVVTLELCTDIYFLDGDTVSMRVPYNILSKGWQ